MTEFSAEVEHLIQGRESYEKLIQRCRPAYSDFKKLIWSTAPDMRPYEDEDKDPMARSYVATVDEESDIGESTSKPVYLKEVRRHIQRLLFLLQTWVCMLKHLIVL